MPYLQLPQSIAVTAKGVELQNAVSSHVQPWKKIGRVVQRDDSVQIYLRGFPMSMRPWITVPRDLVTDGDFDELQRALAANHPVEKARGR